MGGAEMFYITLGFFLITSGSVCHARECDYDEFRACQTELASLETGDFNIVDEEHMKEVCNAKHQTIQCATDFIHNCMKPGERDLYEATTGGKLKVIEDMCTDGSQINRGFVQNLGCFQKLGDEIEFCNDKFKESQAALNKVDMLDRLKVFYGCCAFEWHRNCLAKSARVKCNDEAADFVYHVSTVLGGKVQNQICSSSYSSCHGLHGVSQEEIDERLDNISSRAGPLAKLQAVVPFLTSICFILLCTFF